jgi:amidohydrolase
MINFKEEAEALLPKAIKIRRDFHMHPELSRQEFHTAEVIKTFLAKLGIEVKTDYAGSLPSVVGLLRGKETGSTVALRADMDALQIQEKDEASYKSQNTGVMHACGHDCHCATLMCVAELLAKHKDELSGNVKFIFEPAEEDIGGAKPMIEKGVLDNPKVEGVFGLHCENVYQTGHIGICSGEMLAASDRLFITFKGKSAHGAYPFKGIDAIMLAAHFLVAVQTMMTREKDPFQTAVVTFGIINGGTARNIVCDEVHLSGICRTLNSENREFVIGQIKKILDGIIVVFGGSYEFERQKSHPALYCDPQMTALLAECAGEVIGKENVEVMPHANMVCDSFAYFTEQVPGAYFWLGTGNKAKGINQNLHNSCFDIDESSMATGIAIEASVAYNFLERKGTIDKP